MRRPHHHGYDHIWFLLLDLCYDRAEFSDGERDKLGPDQLSTDLGGVLLHPVCNNSGGIVVGANEHQPLAELLHSPTNGLANLHRRGWSESKGILVADAAFVLDRIDQQRLVA